MCFLLRIAANVGTRPAPPTMADTTSSASGSDATAARPSWPLKISVGRPEQRCLSLAAGDSADMATARGRYRRICSASISSFWPAVRPTTRNSAGNRSTMSSVLVPIDPVEPRMTIDFIAGPSWMRSDPSDERHIVVEGGRGEQETIEPVQHASMPGEQAAGILDADAPFNCRLDEVAPHADKCQKHSERETI